MLLHNTGSSHIRSKIYHNIFKLINWKSKQGSWTGHQNIYNGKWKNWSKTIKWSKEKDVTLRVNWNMDKFNLIKGRVWWKIIMLCDFGSRVWFSQFLFLGASFTEIWVSRRFQLACVGECLTQWGSPVFLPGWLAGPHNQKPELLRLLHGIFFWKSKLRGKVT